MGRQIVDPCAAVDRLSVVEALSKRLVRAVGDWRKHGEGADQLLALALVVALGPRTLRTVISHLNQPMENLSNDRHHEAPS